MRVSVLTLALVVAAFVLVVVLKYNADYAPLCVPNTPTLAGLTAAEARALRAQLTDAMDAAGGETYSSGAVPTEVAFTDEPASSSTIRLGSDGRSEGSYEIRQWAADPQFGNRSRDDLAADAFVFASAAEAKSFFATASSVSCHRHARYALASSRTARLSWLNPDGAVQEDVYVLQGPRVYRIVDVPPGERAGRTPRAIARAFARASQLLCGVAGAACARAGTAASFLSEARAAVCRLNGELGLLHGRGPAQVAWRDPAEQLVLSRALARLQAIEPPPARAAPFAAFVAALRRLAEVAGGARSAGVAPGDEGELTRLGTFLEIYECEPIEPLHPTLGTYRALYMTSAHWAGYGVNIPDVTGVRARWRVPGLSDPGSEPTSVSALIGIGSRGVPASQRNWIILGATTYASRSGRPSVKTYYSLSTLGSAEPRLVVRVGDEVSAEITQTRVDLWTLKLEDRASGRFLRRVVFFRSLRASAEAMAELPNEGEAKPTRLEALHFADVSLRRGSTWQRFEAAPWEAEHLIQHGTVLASPTPLRGGSYTVNFEPEAAPR